MEYLLLCDFLYLTGCFQVSLMSLWAPHFLCRNNTVLCWLLDMLSSCSNGVMCVPLTVSCASFHSELSDHSLWNSQRPHPRWSHMLFKPCFSCAQLLSQLIITHSSRGILTNGPPQLNPRIDETRNHPEISFHTVPSRYSRPWYRNLCHTNVVEIMFC